MKVLVMCCVKCDRIVLMKSTNFLLSLVLDWLALLLRMRKVPVSDLVAGNEFICPVNYVFNITLRIVTFHHKICCTESHSHEVFM